MKRVIGKILVATAAAAVVLAVAGVNTPAFASKGEITIWINSDKGYNGLAKVGEKFTKATGVKVTVEHPQDAPAKFQAAASSGQGPDIFLWAHDRLGEWQSGGLIAEVRPSAAVRRALEQKGWDAFTIGGKLWGYPVAFEAVGLVYNKKLVSKPPKTFEEIVALHKRLQKQNKRAILWDFNNTYFTFPLLAAQGGYAFKRQRDGRYDARDIGVNNAGAVKGLEMLLRLISEGVMPRGTQYSDMETAMGKGEVAMMINGPWSWANLSAAGISFGVAELPTIGGKPARPFVGVLGAMVNQASPRKEIAVEFIEKYLLTAPNLKLIDDDKKIGVPAHKGFFNQLRKDPLIVATMKNVRNGVLMPNNPEMGKFWSAMAAALENATQGRQGAKEALDAAAKRMQ